MKSEKQDYLLQLFAEEAAQGSGEDAAADSEQNAPAREEQSPAEQMDDPAAEFEELIKGKYKEQYAERVQKIIDKRFRKAREDEALLEKLRSEDAGNRQKAAEEPADEKLDGIRKSTDRVRERKKQFASWMSQSSALAEKYPAFDFANEVRTNAGFVELLNAGASVETAFKAANLDSFLREARDSAAREAKAAMVSSVRSNGIRPVENGMASGAPAVRTASPGNLSLGEINDLFARAGRGEKITFR